MFSDTKECDSFTTCKELQGMQAPLLSNTERHRNFANPHPRIMKTKIWKLQFLVRAFNKPGLVAYQSKKANISNQLSC